MGDSSVATTTINRYLFWATALFLTIGLGLIILSWTGVCTSACSAAHNYRLFGTTFELTGLLFFTTTLILHLFSYITRPLAALTALFIASGLGAEAWFMYVQKALIGSWCPVCLLIASTLAVTGILYALLHNRGWFFMLNKGYTTRWMSGGAPSLAAWIMGFTLAFLGTTKINPLHAAQESLKESVAFGQATSPIEVYLFTDWFCPACRTVEREFDRMVPTIESQAKLFFIDADLNAESLNFTPYNLSFMVNNKGKYLELRHALADLSNKTKTPTEAQVKAAIAPLGVKLQELNFSDITLGAKLFKKLARQFNVNATPTIVVINVNTKKGKKLSGTQEISQANINKAIQSLK